MSLDVGMQAVGHTYRDIVIKEKQDPKDYAKWKRDTDPFPI
jgi:hypothetical protein